MKLTEEFFWNDRMTYKILSDEIIKQILNDQKLRELIENKEFIDKIMHDILYDAENTWFIEKKMRELLQNLLEESKK